MKTFLIILGFWTFCNFVAGGCNRIERSEPDE